MTDGTGLHVHRAERADTLAEALGALLAVPLPDPFTSEVVAVPARGVERWLAQRLSHRLGAVHGDGVCAGVRFSSAASIVRTALGAAAGIDPDADPWRPERAVWPLLEVLDASWDERWYAPLAAQRGRRWALARRLADLFADYAAHRPGLVCGWLAGQDGVPPDLAWQPALWRALRERIGAPDPAERLGPACVALAADPDVVDLPPRLSLFGPTRLAAAELAALRGLAAHRAVHLWLPHPSPALWAAVAATAPRAMAPTRAADTSGHGVTHPLLASLGRDVREMQVRLAAAVPATTDRHHPAPEPPPTLLGRLQRDLRDDRPPDATHRMAAGDDSVQVHACHGPDRQVEVLREVVLGCLAADPTLQPRDVLVMCPDVETFAPLVSAAFGLGERPGSHPGHALPVRLADRALRQVNPLLDVVARLLELADARLCAAEALDLLATDPVRRRFGLDDDDLARVAELVTRAGVRWGLDATHRGPYRLAGFPQNTWAAGLDRLLLGVAAAGDDWLGTALPLTDVEPADTVRVGRLAEFVERLATVLGSLAGPQPLDAWFAALAGGLDLLTDTAAGDAWQAAQARAELAAAAAAAGGRAGTVTLTLADVRALLAERLRGRPTRANFRTGTLTVATLVPMRSVPHRVVCLLGLDDGVFPRAAVVDGDDALARDPLVGERDARAEDRQLLLDAVCAATETLVVVHSGADPRTGARRPPAVPLGELLDTIAATAPGADVVTRHPLQPFDARNFAAGPGTGPFSFDRTELAGARALATPPAPPPPLLAAPLPPRRDDTVLLDDLVRFVEHPVQAFLRQRVGLAGSDVDTSPGDALPVELEPLAYWAVGDRLLRDRLAGRSVQRCCQAEWRRGELPPGALGEALLTRVLDDVEALVAAAAGAGRRPGGTPADCDVDVPVPGGTRVTGTVADLFDDALVRVEYSRLAPKQRIRAWVRLLALTASTGRPWRAVTIGRGDRHGVQIASIPPVVGPAEAAARLGELVALRAEGLCEPLPLPLAAAHAYARVHAGSHDAEDALAQARREWTTGRERHDDAHVRAWGRGAPAAVLDPASGPADPGRFGPLALRLWEPLLAVEEVLRR